MAYMEILRGLPASGKSTYAKSEVAIDPNLVRVNRDAIRWTQGCFPIGNKVEEELVSDIEVALIKGSLRKGRSVVIDATNLNNEALTKFYKIAKKLGIEDVRVKDFPVAIAELLERDAGREKSVGAGVIAKMAKRYGIGDDGILRPARKWVAPERPNLARAAEWDDLLPTAWIVDTDGTIANHEGIRSPYDTSHYHLDTVHEDVANLVRNLQEDIYIIGVSGRDAAFREVTERWWLEKAFLKADEFYFRPEGDKRPDDVIKAEIYENHIRGRYNIAGVLDDRGRVLRMWRAKGITTFAVGDTDNNDF